MKKDTLQVGTKDFSVSVEIQLPETLADCAMLAKCDEFVAERMTPLTGYKSTGVDYLVSKFTRGYRIDLQEGGARQTVVEMLGGKSGTLMQKDAEFVAKVKAAVEAEIAEFNPATPRARGRKAAAPVTVAIDPNKKYSQAEIMELLKNVKGVTVVSE